MEHGTVHDTAGEVQAEIWEGGRERGRDRPTYLDPRKVRSGKRGPDV